MLFVKLGHFLFLIGLDLPTRGLLARVCHRNQKVA